MEERPNHLTVVIGASSVAEDLRRSLVQHGESHAGVTTHLRGLRRTMVLPKKQDELVVVCVSLDRATMERHGSSVRRLLADHQGPRRCVRSVGLLASPGLTREMAEMGFDVFVEDAVQAVKAVKLLARKWRDNRRRQAAAARALRADRLKDVTQSEVWSWDLDIQPTSLEPLASNRPAKRDQGARRNNLRTGRTEPPAPD
jgi:hypothetical protein